MPYYTLIYFYTFSKSTIDTPLESNRKSLRTNRFSFLVLFITIDRIRAVSQRSELKSCTALMDEQSNPF